MNLESGFVWVSILETSVPSCLDWPGAVLAATPLSPLYSYCVHRDQVLSPREMEVTQGPLRLWVQGFPLGV